MSNDEQIRLAMPDDLVVNAVDGRRVLVRPFRYFRPNGDCITVPAGFETDFASVPRLLWVWLPPHGKYERAAVVHDFLCMEGGKVTIGDRVVRYSSDQAADIFGEAMEVLGVWALRRWVMVTAVKKFGPRF